MPFSNTILPLTPLLSNGTTTRGTMHWLIRAEEPQHDTTPACSQEPPTWSLPAALQCQRIPHNDTEGEEAEDARSEGWASGHGCTLQCGWYHISQAFWLSEEGLWLHWEPLYRDGDGEDAEPSGSPHGDLSIIGTSTVRQFHLWLQTSFSSSIAKLSAGAELLGLGFGGFVRVYCYSIVNSA